MEFTEAISSLYDATLALFYPQACGGCDAGLEKRLNWPACEDCWSKTRTFSDRDTYCWKCSRLAAGVVRTEAKEQVRCHLCDADAYTAARAVGSYEGALRLQVLRLKHEPFVGQRVAELLFERFDQPPLNTATRILPVPLHPLRQRSRGFNQAAILGRALAVRAHLPFDERSLARTAHTAAYRAGMDTQDRRASVASAFAVSRPGLIGDERILLVDDVFTTGATVSACAEVLRAAGAAEVFVLTIARAELHDA